MKTSAGCPQCAMRHALYVKAHRQLQEAGRKILALEAELKALRMQLGVHSEPEKPDAG